MNQLKCYCLSLRSSCAWSPARIDGPGPTVGQLELVAGIAEGLLPAEFKAKCCVDQAAHGEHDCFGELAWQIHRKDDEWVDWLAAVVDEARQVERERSVSDHHLQRRVKFAARDGNQFS